MEYLYILREALVWITTIFWIYQILVSLCSLIKLKDKPLLVNKEHKFMAIIPAHNEENVIANLLESLKNQNYNKDLYDVYVIADNCTDNTAKIAKEHGAIVYKRFDSKNKTKGAALDWFLQQKIEENADYDALFIFDADNIVDTNFIKNMNKKLCQGEDVVQGYRDIKNPTDNWISSGYAIFYWMMHRFYHLARYNLGLSPLLNGTGFMVNFNIIKQEGGWKTETLTEDIEFSLRRIVKGKRLGWATDAIVYDEQPTDFAQSWNQRSRWSTGHIQCIEKYTKPLAKAVKEHKTVMNFDGFLYLMGTFPMLIVSLIILLTNIIMYSANELTSAEFVVNVLMFVVTTFCLQGLSAMFVMFLDRRPIKPMVKGLLCYPLFLLTWLLINLKCLIKRETTWKKIEHVRNIKVNDVKIAD
ncbi:MAG: glycosyltransferase family 2 protein [Clostridia bacterium]|nr:glycosyltransferase family 2 protein [Clostridia bacterium]